MGRLKALIPLVLAVVVAFAASTMIYRWIQTKTAAPVQPAEQVAQAQVAVASADLPWGTKITPEMVKLVPLPQQYTPAGAFATVAAVQDRVTVAPLKMNEPILEFKLAPTSITTGGVTALIEPGKRAIAVAGDKVIGLAGFIHPGSRVDVLLTIKDAQSDAGQITKTVLEDVLVLATGSMMEKKGANEPSPVDVFTLQVTPEEGERLALAASQGRLHFALRNSTDKETVLTMGATVPDTLDAYRPRLTRVATPAPKLEAPVGVRAPESHRSNFKMRLIKGTAVKEVSFN